MWIGGGGGVGIRGFGWVCLVVRTTELQPHLLDQVQKGSALEAE